jgi:cellulose synthase/poly-beta-1,6-N-acetylglucosamine synthase-like glycosyltransferase
MLESKIGSVFAADGLLYAIRRELFVPLTNPANGDDISISTKVPLSGYRLLFDRNATAWETGTVDAKSEFKRKVRITNRSIRACMSLGSKLFTTGLYGIEVLSHKLVRHFIPLFLIPMLLVSIPLAMHSLFFAVMLGGQVAVYVLGAIGSTLRETPFGRWRIFSVPYYFCFVNTCAFFGIMKLFRGHQTAAWSTRPVITNAK